MLEILKFIGTIVGVGFIVFAILFWAGGIVAWLTKDIQKNKRDKTFYE